MEFKEENSTFNIDNEIHTCEYFTSETLADVKFIFGGAKEIPAHKFILANKSSVFRQMFFGGLKETGNIQIVDATPGAFTEFLQFFYLREVKLSIDHITNVMYLADKYDVAQCVPACSKFLKDTLRHENTLWVYEMAQLYNYKDLKAYCEEQIQFCPTLFFLDTSFKNCDRGVLKGILSLNLHCDELTVFNACIDWAKYACERENIFGNTENFKNVLGDCFQLIRFPSMTSKEFSSVLENHASFFDVDTLADIFMYISLERPLKVATQFNANRRQKNLTLIRYRNDSEFCYHKIQQVEVVKFSTNQQIVLDGIVINENIHSLIKTELLGNIKIFRLDISTDYLLLDQPVRVSNVRSNYYKFHKPIVIHSQHKHEIQIVSDTILKGKTFPVTLLEYDPIVKLKEGIEFQFFSKASAQYDCVRYGLISGLSFSPM